MVLDLDARSPIPIYRQIVDQIRRLVATGALREGERLPTVRDLAVQARVNRNTAARAIQDLEREGIVRTRVGQGTFVAEGASRAVPERLQEALDGAIDRLLVDARLSGVAIEDLDARIARRIEEFRRSGRSEPAPREEGSE